MQRGRWCRERCRGVQRPVPLDAQERFIIGRFRALPETGRDAIREALADLNNGAPRAAVERRIFAGFGLDPWQVDQIMRAGVRLVKS